MDSNLIDSVKEGRAVLFLGAGASRGAAHPENKIIPDAATLANLLVEEFLPDRYRNTELRKVYDYACANRSVPAVQEFLYNLLVDFNPADFHISIPKFPWSGLVTTNYDLIIERAYEKCSEKMQSITSYSSDDDIPHLKEDPNSILYVKLHGCISKYQILSPPLIASTEQLIESQDGRKGLFAQFLEWAKAKSIIFVGYGFDDSNIRTLVHAILHDGEKRAQHFIVNPYLDEIQKKFWAERRVHPIAMDFESFLICLEEEIPKNTRRLGSLINQSSVEHSTLRPFISVSGATESSKLKNYLERGIQHISRELHIDEKDAQRFYGGFDLDWYPFDLKLDVSRRLSDDILLEQIIPTMNIDRPEFYLIRGSAGSGKSVILRRLAWDSGKEYEKISLYVGRNEYIDINLIEEIVSLTNMPVFIFIDDAREHKDSIRDLMNSAIAKNWQVVVFCAERTNEWNLFCEDLDELLSRIYDVRYLSEKEIKELLVKLDEHNSLGILKDLHPDERFERLKESYGRQLLVALHEATKGKPFREIVSDEYMNLNPPEAQTLYLDICALHQFGPPVRAGLISRIHDITFEEFKNKFFLPLENVVITSWDAITRDYVYISRHHLIAEMVFDDNLQDQESRFELMMRIISKLNPTYSYDQRVLTGLVNYRVTSKYFSDTAKARSIYDAVLTSMGRDAHILQHYALYEKGKSNDIRELNKAEELLQEAESLAPWDNGIKHSFSELYLAKSDLSKSNMEMKSYLNKAEKIANDLIRKKPRTPHAYHTLSKISNKRLANAVERYEEENSQLNFESLNTAINDADIIIQKGLQQFPNAPYLLTEYASFNDILNKSEKALLSLKKAFTENPRSVYVATRLVRTLNSKEDYEESKEILQKALEVNNSNLLLHRMMADVLRTLDPEKEWQTGESEIEYHLRRSFTPNDKNYESQFRYARHLSLHGNWEEAKKIFGILKKVPLSYTQKMEPRLPVIDRNAKNIEYTGRVLKITSTYGFVKIDTLGVDVYLGSEQVSDIEATIKYNDQVKFNLYFNMLGPVAVNIFPI